jgi:predicted O-linked N-acetylglucosamine transferase (SPINDLY family)
MDYIIADSVVIPRMLQRGYAEKIIYLPWSFMPFDSRNSIADRLFKREELGLPPDGFVFCCFNTCSKLTPELFDCWMRILKRAENSVLSLSISLAFVLQTFSSTPFHTMPIQLP